jgi:hypothetical protein
MPRMRFEPTIPAFERAKTFHALDRAATANGLLHGCAVKNLTVRATKEGNRVVLNILLSHSYFIITAILHSAQNLVSSRFLSKSEEIKYAKLQLCL